MLFMTLYVYVFIMKTNNNQKEMNKQMELKPYDDPAVIQV